MSAASSSEATASARDRIDRLGASLPNRVDLQGPARRFVAAGLAHMIRAGLIWRMEEISRRALNAIDERDLVVGAILVRASMETTALAIYVHDKIKAALELGASGDLKEKLGDIWTGSKSWPELPGAVNILTCVDRVDRLIPGFRQTYDSLSEVAHPNWSGVTGSYSTIDQDRLLVSLTRGGRNPKHRHLVATQSLDGALGLFEFYYNVLGDQVGLVADLYEREKRDAARSRAR